MKGIVVFLFTILISFGLYAQQAATLIGVKGGYTQSNLWGSNVNDSLSTGGNPMVRNGFNLGLGLNSMLGKNIWLKHDLLFVQKGAVLKINDKQNSIYNSKLKLAYLDLYPCSPTFHYKGIQLFVGPYLGMLLNSSVQRKDSAGNNNKDKSIYGNAKSSKNYTQKIDLGFVAGIEYELPIGLNVGIRYVQGFVPLIENPLIQSTQSRIYVRNLNFSIGYTFGKQKE